jgi:hypothetical protein
MGLFTKDIATMDNLLLLGSRTFITPKTRS